MKQNSIDLLEGKWRICKICDSPSDILGSVPFSKGKNPALCGNLADKQVFYNLCPDCGTLFTCAFDHWTMTELATHIYNSDFGKIDTAIETGERARYFATTVASLFAGFGPSISVLDYGGADGTFSTELQQCGFTNVQSFDPFIGDSRTVTGESFDLVTTFEVLEHSTTPVLTVKDICGFTKPAGMILFSTEVLPNEVDLNWWYVVPRGGHTTLYTKKSLSLSFSYCGFKVVSLSNNLHFAYREIPLFAKKFLHRDLPDDFNPAGYLRMNPDVQASGMDPGGHYVRHGWRESRQWR
jgi:Methyltransferase domain